MLRRFGIIDVSQIRIQLGTQEIEQVMENRYFIEVCVPDDVQERITVYIAEIYGTDKPEIDDCFDTRSYLYILKNLERIRFLLILIDGHRYLYPYEEFGDEYALYAAFLFWLQYAGEERAKRMFFGKGESGRE